MTRPSYRLESVAVAVLTGAFWVGDSMRGRPRQLTLERLGQNTTCGPSSR